MKNQKRDVRQGSNRIKVIQSQWRTSKSHKSFDIEANLRSWGLLGHTAIEREDNRMTRMMKFARRKIFWHRFRLFILWCLTIKLFYCCTLSNDDPLVYYLGDASGFMGVPKLEMGLIMALWTLPGPLVIFEFIKFKNTKRMQSWVKIYDMFMEKNITEGFNHNKLQKTFADIHIRQRFRLRISQTLGLFRFFVTGALTTSGGAIVYTLLVYWPEEYRRSIWSFLWAFINVFWIYFNQKSIKSCLIIFIQICYYITLRFRRFNANLNHLLHNWDNYRVSNNRRLWALLKEHDAITELTLNCNKFWSLFIITNTSIKIPLLLLSIHVTLFYNLPGPGRFVAIFMTCSIFLYTTLIYYSASQVEYTSRQCYQTLFSLSMKRISLPVRYKILNTIQRISKHSIGFDIYAVHTITYLRYFEAIIASAIAFLLVVGLKFNDLQKTYLQLIHST